MSVYVSMYVRMWVCVSVCVHIITNKENKPYIWERARDAFEKFEGENKKGEMI